MIVASPSPLTAHRSRRRAGNSPRSARRRFRGYTETAQVPAGQSEEHRAAQELRGDDRQEEHARKTQDQSGDQPGELSGAGMSCGDRDGDGMLRTQVADDQAGAGGSTPNQPRRGDHP
jgi:hypothetical protein